MLATFLALALSAQQVLPAGPTVAGGLADAREPRMAIGFLKSDLFADELIARQQPALGDVASDTHGVVELGVDFPLLRVQDVTVSLQGGVISRFRLETSDNDAMSSDYIVALPLGFVRGRSEARVRLIHRSAHLGDELVQNAGVRRLEYDHEEIDALVARRFGPVRLYAGGSLTLASSFTDDKHALQLGADGEWPLPGRLAAVGGIDWQKHSIAQGPSRLAGVLGVRAHGPAGQASLEARMSTGASELGEFFLEKESYWGMAFTVSRRLGNPRFR